MNKKNILLMMVAASIFFFAGYVVSFHEAKGVVVKIEGGYLSILDSVGQMVTISGNNPDEFKNIKVGDKVSIKDGKIFKEIHLASVRPSPGYFNEINLSTMPVFPR